MYIVASYIDIFAIVPQIAKIIITKNTKDISLTMWVMWLFSQSIVTFYTFRQGDDLMKLVSFGWLIADISLITIILYYRYMYKPKTAILNRVNNGKKKDASKIN